MLLITKMTSVTYSHTVKRENFTIHLTCLLVITYTLFSLEKTLTMKKDFDK
jgi:hypothetical protein